MPSSPPTSRTLSGKTILITGASSGIGRSTACEFARTSPESLKLILTARRLDRLQDIARQIREDVGDGVKIHVKQFDVSKLDEIEGLMDSLPEEFRQIDVLVNNA
jgi:3-hydroxy acid dehydrogenase/malonic semialdehyde reductase